MRREKWATGSPRPSLLVLPTTTKMAMQCARAWRPLTCGFQNAREWQGERMPHDDVAPYGFAEVMVVIGILKVKARRVSA